MVALGAPLAAQQQKHVAYPERDILSPFRFPGEVYAPPDRLFFLLRRMRVLAANQGNPRRIDDEGRQLIDHEGWRTAYDEVMSIGVDAAYLAQILRLSKNADDRATALYGMFFCKQPENIANLISHIPGEPERKAREMAFPLAVQWLQVHLKRRFGDLGEEAKKNLVLALPKLGSPAAKAAGITRLPRDDDHLVDLRVIPFLQLLDLDDPLDQAQGMWFCKEMFAIRVDLALKWLEPALPRVRQLLVADDPQVRKEAIGLLRAIGPKDLPEIADDAAPAALQAWADRAVRNLFPPIRNLNNTIVALYPSPERDALVAAGLEALEGDKLGETKFGRTKDGQNYRGYCLRHVPEALRPLALPVGATVTTVNGLPITDAASLLRTVRELLQVQKHPRSLLVEYIRDDAVHAVEFRVM